MRIKQIEYAIAVAKNKSFSKAAEELYVSQPNISSTINLLESELGFKIFDRTNKGIDITSEGVIFLKYANGIMEELNNLPSLIKKESHNKLSIGSTFNHTIVSKAFVNLCKEIENVDNLDLSIYSDSNKNIIEKVYMNESDLGILFVNPIILNNYKNTMYKNDLDFEILTSMSLNVNVREDHPLLLFKNFHFEDLYNFPFINYNFNMTTDIHLISDFPDIVSMGFINPNKIINVNERETRREILLATDGYSIGSSFHPSMNKIDQIVSIPIPNGEAILALVYKKSISSNELELFTRLLNYELTKVVDKNKNK